MAGFGRRSKPLKAGTALSEVDGVSLSGLADGDLLVYDATAEAFLNTKTLDSSYVISGGLTAATLTTSGNVTFGGALSVAGNSSLSGTLTVGGTSTLQAASLVSLSVSGASTLTGATTIVGGLTANAADFAQLVTMNLGLTVFGSTTLGAVSAASLDLSGTLDVDGAAVLGSSLSVAGDLTVSGLIATGSAFSAPSIGSTGTLTAGGATTLFSTLSVAGAATFASTLQVTGALTGLSTAAFGTVAGAYTITDGWGISGALSNAVTGNQDAKLSFRNGGRSTQVAQIGFETGTTFAVRSQTHGGTLLMSAEDSAGNVEQAFAYVPDGGGFLYHAGLNRAFTTSTGFGIARDLNNAVTGNQDAQLSFRNAGLSTEVGLIGYETGLGLVIRNQTHGGSITMSVEDAAGNVETGLVITPDAGVALRFANSLKFETVTNGVSVTGNVDFNQGQAVEMRLENLTADPGSPAVGQIWLRTDL